MDGEWENNSGLQERQKDNEKREKEEMKRLEKLVFRKDQNEVEDIYNSGNAKALKERIARTINQSILKQSQILARVQASHTEAEAQVVKAR